MEVRVDGAASWTEVHAFPSFNASSGVLLLTGFLPGDHSIQVRGTDGTAGPDKTPWTTEWHIDTAAPVVKFLQAPRPYTAVPTTTARFVLSTDKPTATALQYTVYQQTAPPNNGTPTPSQSQWQPAPGFSAGAWLPVGQGPLLIMGLTPGVLYRLDARGNTTLGVIGAPTSVQWASAACLSPPDAAITSLQAVSMDYGVRVAVWSAVDDAAPLPRVAGYQVAVDGAGAWTNVSDTFLQLPAEALNAQHTVAVRAIVPPQCVSFVGAGVYPATNVTWYEYGYAPGLPGFTITPPAQSTSAYADFSFFSSALPETSSFQYSLDASSWSGCGGSLQVGPLSSGGHTLQLRTMKDGVGGAPPVVSGAVSFNWLVISLSNSTVSLNYLSDG